jgi:hypothetical protein
MIKLSELDPELDIEEIINFLLDKKIYIVVNDLVTKKPFIKYELNDLYQVWDFLRMTLVLKG